MQKCQFSNVNETLSEHKKKTIYPVIIRLCVLYTCVLACLSRASTRVFHPYCRVYETACLPVCATTRCRRFCSLTSFLLVHQLLVFLATRVIGFFFLSSFYRHLVFFYPFPFSIFLFLAFPFHLFSLLFRYNHFLLNFFRVIHLPVCPFFQLTVCPSLCLSVLPIDCLSLPLFVRSSADVLNDLKRKLDNKSRRDVGH